MIEHFPKCEVKKGPGEGIARLVKVFAKGEGDETRRKMIYRLIEIIAKDHVSKGRRE